MRKEMNEQERLHRIIDILADNAHEMCAVEGDTNDIILDVNMDGVQTVAKEISQLFNQELKDIVQIFDREMKKARQRIAELQPPHKDTRTRRERALDIEFERIGVKPRVYHFTKEIVTFNAVTVALAKRWRKGVTEDIVKNCVKAAHDEMENKATFSIAILKQAAIYGVAICDKRDQFNKRRGRMKAKGRLLQHLLKEAQKE